MSTILLTSKSSLKLGVVSDIFPPNKYTITCVDCDAGNVILPDGTILLGPKKYDLPSQPVNCSDACATARLKYAKSIKSLPAFDYYISIENGIYTDDIIQMPIGPKLRPPYEVCDVIIEHENKTVQSRGDIIFSINPDHWNILRKTELLWKPHHTMGYHKTIGDIANSLDPTIDPKNWVKSIYGICRSEQIKSSLSSALDQL